MGLFGAKTEVAGKRTVTSAVPAQQKTKTAKNARSGPAVIVMPADSTFGGQWEIRADSHVTVKNLNWKIR